MEKKLSTGLYFLLLRGAVVYIGQTTRFPDRLYYHKNQLLPHDCVRFIACKKVNLDQYEKRWIKKFKPQYNSTHKPKEKQKVIKRFENPERKKYMKFRKLTKKSTVGFGMYRDMTVGHMLNTGRMFDVISFYYKLSHITFADDLLKELQITGEWAIQKPGIDPERYISFCTNVYPNEFEERRLKIFSRAKRGAKLKLQHIANHDHSKSYHRQFNQK